ncbi:hypothetical protein BYT27DRAFT_7263992 [Phlegmacium glaucopus]|nr:hypothetical protein BYT27DRAFT_7263992 [Phlegmacium glaucopus]
MGALHLEFVQDGLGSPDELASDVWAGLKLVEKKEVAYVSSAANKARRRLARIGPSLSKTARLLFSAVWSETRGIESFVSTAYRPKRPTPQARHVDVPQADLMPPLALENPTQRDLNLVVTSTFLTATLASDAGIKTTRRKPPIAFLTVL